MMFVYDVLHQPESGIFNIVHATTCVEKVYNISIQRYCMVTRGLRDILKGCLKLGTVELASGNISNYYFDVKSLLMTPWHLESIADGVLDESADIEYTRFAGVELGSVPIVVAMSIITGMRYAIVRKPKDHGLTSDVIGNVDGDDVLLVEDVATTGDSALRCAKELMESGAKSVTVLAIIDRQDGAEKLLAENGFGFRALVTGKELVDDVPWNT